MNSKLSKKITVSNVGDIPARFNWETDFCEQYFTIDPKRGVIPS